MASIAITGATGFVGHHVATALRAAGHNCIELSRARGPNQSNWRRFDLAAPTPDNLLSGCDTLIHAAWDLRVTTRDAVLTTNVAGSIALFERAARCGVRRIVFLSSMSAYDGTKQLYGRSKLLCERAAADFGGVSLRLGLVYSAQAGGMVGSLRKAMSHRIVPAVGLDSYQFLVHLDDAVDAITTATTDSSLNGVLGVAHPDPVPTRTILAGLAPAGSPIPRLVPIPWRFLFHSMNAAERLGARLPFRSDSILGLVRPAPMVPRASEWPARGVIFRRVFPAGSDTVACNPAQNQPSHVPSDAFVNLHVDG